MEERGAAEKHRLSKLAECALFPEYFFQWKLVPAVIFTHGAPLGLTEGDCHSKQSYSAIGVSQVPGKAVLSNSTEGPTRQERPEKWSGLLYA